MDDRDANDADDGDRDDGRSKGDTRQAGALWKAVATGVVAGCPGVALLAGIGVLLTMSGIGPDPGHGK